MTISTMSSDLRKPDGAVTERDALLVSSSAAALDNNNDNHQTRQHPTLAKHASLASTNGRGKQRFKARQKLKDTSKRVVYSSMFGPPRSSQKVSSPLRKKHDKSFGSNKDGIEDGDDNDDAAKQPEKQRKKKHSWLFDTLNPRKATPASNAYKSIISTVILIDAVFFVASTEPTLSHLPIFYYAEAATSTIFLLEYCARMVVCTEYRRYSHLGPIRGRLRYASQGHAIADALATLPFFIELLLGVDLPTLTYVRVFRLLRITKTSSYSKAFDAVWRVFYFNREILTVAGMLGIYLVIFTSILMYYLRPRGADADLIDDLSDFSSIARTMKLSVLMLTGQGGPSGDLPWYTQIVVLITGVFSLGMFAIPASMLTWGFEAEAQRLAMRSRKKLAAERSGRMEENSTSSSSSGWNHNGDCSSSSISTSDQEYMDLIGDWAEKDPSAQPATFIGGGGGVDPLVVESLKERMDQLDKKLDLILSKLE